MADSFSRRQNGVNNRKNATGLISIPTSLLSSLRHENSGTDALTGGE